MPRFLGFLCTLTALLAPAACASAEDKPVQHDLDAVEIFHCAFDTDEWDVNYDGWPDKWTRKTGPLYPHYVRMELVDDDQLGFGRALEIRLDGAKALVSSPPIRVLPKFSYSLKLKIKTSGIEHSQATVVLDFLAADGEVIQTHRSEPIAQTNGWLDVEIGKYRPASDLVDRVIAHIEVEHGERGDLHGVIRVADCWLGRWPSMEVTTNSLFNVYDNPDDVVITCSLSGISEKNPDIQFQLLDATQTELHNQGASGSKELQGRVIRQETRDASEMIAGDGRHNEGYEGSTEWSPDIRNNGIYGFYRVRVRMISKETKAMMDERVITLAVVPPAIESATGEFGWSLPESVPRLGEPLDFETLQELLPLAGMSWVKLPVWFPREETERGDQIIQFAERLAATDIETIGILQPPEQNEKKLPGQPEAHSEIEYTFRRDASMWVPLFDHVMNRLSLRLRWWQLGYDHDTSFVGHEDLVGKIHDIRGQLYRFGQDVRLGIGWRWDALPIGGHVSWEFEQLSADPPLQSEELDYNLVQRPFEGTPRWVLIEPRIEPDDASHGSVREQHEARVREFIRQIIVAKKHGAEGIFIPQPFSGMDGVMNTDGTPGELLLPWRTAATLLGGAKFIGSLNLPGKSNNWLFLRPNQPPDKRVVMVVWNDKETDEVLYLGDKVQRIDVWGKPEKPKQEEHRQVIHVGPEPAFVLGVNESVARLRMSVAFENEAIPSVFGYEHQNALLFSNEFGAGIGGVVSLFVPDMVRGGEHSPDNASRQWDIYMPEGEEVRAGAGMTVRHPIQIELDDATFGEQPIRIDFDLNNQYKFSVYRTLRVGMGDIDIKATSFLEEGRLVVQQRMVSLDGPRTDFKCSMTVFGRRRKRTQVFQLGPEPDIKTYIYPNGEELVGQDVKLQIEEIDGDRILIYRFVATREPEFVFEEAE